MGESLSNPIAFPVGEDPYELFNKAYDIFCLVFGLKEERPNLLNKFIYIDTRKTFDGEKFDGFWHIASIRTGEKYDMFPCYNNIAYEKCKFLCQINHENNFLKNKKSVPCLYRADKIIWIKEIINIVNENKKHKNLKIWKQKNKKREERLLIRYVSKNIDYVIIFRIHYKGKSVHYYRLITAYPVVLKSYKRRYDREYRQYILSK